MNKQALSSWGCVGAVSDEEVERCVCAQGCGQDLLFSPPARANCGVQGDLGALKLLFN